MSEFISNNQVLVTVVGYGLLIFLAWFFLFRPNSKKKKQEQEMRDNTEIGDEITTIGGIVGRVISIKEDSESYMIETGVDRSKVLVRKWAISSNDTKNAQLNTKK